MPPTPKKKDEEPKGDATGDAPKADEEPKADGATDNGDHSVAVAVKILKPPVQVRDVDAEIIGQMIEAATGAGKGEFASTGEEFATREVASKLASKFVRAMDSRSPHPFRSRTWELDSGKWVFGVALKTTADADETTA